MFYVLAKLFDKCAKCHEDKTPCAEKLGITVEQMETLIELHIKTSKAADEFMLLAETIIDFDALIDKAKEDFGDTGFDPKPPFNPSLN